MLVASSNVRVREDSGRYVLLLSSSQFDPERKSSADRSVYHLDEQVI
jgi:hypothetical protein